MPAIDSRPSVSAVRVVPSACARALVLLGLAAELLFAGDLFPRPTSEDLAERPGTMLAEDLNGDGRLDIIVAHPSDASVSVLLQRNQEGLSLGDPRRLPVGLSPVALDAGDLDGSDGLDAIVVESGSGTVTVLRNDGNGRLQKAASVEVGLDPRVARLGDVNGDGNLDLVVGNVSSRSLQVFHGDGNGKLTRKAEPEVGGNPHALALEDFDGDQKLDIVVVYANSEVGGVQLLLGRGDGRFRSPVATSLEEVDNAVPRLLATGDFNQDGRLDAGIITDDERLLGLELRSTGRFDVDQIARVEVDRAELLAAVDFTADGLLDLVVPAVKEGGAGIAIHRGKGDGEFEPGGDVLFSAPFKSIAARDLDGDGVLDLAGAQASPAAILLVRGAGPGRLATRKQLGLGAAPRAITSVDLGHDGIEEIVVASAQALHLVRVAGQDLERFEKRDFPGRAFEALASGQFGLAAPFQIVGLDTAGEALLLVGLGEDGEATGTRELASSGLPRRLAALDWNGDGLTDLALARAAATSLDLVLLAVEGDNPTHVEIDVGSPQAAVAAGDWDGDTRPDLLVGTSSGLLIALNPGGEGTAALLDLQEPARVAAGALFLRGKQGVSSYAAIAGEEILVASRDAALPPFRRELAGTLESLRVEDVSGDSIPDLVAGMRGALLVLRGLEDGEFGEVERYPLSGTPRALVTGSFFPGGRLDVATADLDARSISVLPGTAIRANPPTRAVRRGDADQDGSVTLTDALILLRALFQTGVAPRCADGADADDSGELNLTDAVVILDFLFRSGAPLAPPGPSTCAPDPTPDSLPDCAEGGCR